MKGNQFSIPLVLVFAALMAHQAAATPSPEINTSQVSADLLKERETLRERLDAAAEKTTPLERDGRISQWYNSRFSNRSFSNW